MRFIRGLGFKGGIFVLKHTVCMPKVQIYRAGHNFRCPLVSPLSVDPLVNGTALILHFENVNLTEERLFLSLLKASTLNIRFCRIF
jgi:hypothetical protein